MNGIIEDAYITSEDNHLFANNSWLWLGGVLRNAYNNSIFWLLVLSYGKSIDSPINWILMIIVISSISIIIILISIYLLKRRK